MGTILRTAEAAAVTGIIMSSDCVDVYNPKVIRSTMAEKLASSRVILSIVIELSCLFTSHNSISKLTG